jgi:hypothetical protein
MNTIKVLQEWFLCNCNGDWEHENGISVSTIDNPGWCIKIDLNGTPLENVSFEKKMENNGGDWYDIKTDNNIFIGYCGYTKIEELVSIFYNDFFLPVLVTSEFEYEIYSRVPNIEPGIWRPVVARMIDLNKFLIMDVPKINKATIKVKKIEDYGSIDFNKVPIDSEYKKGDIVGCSLDYMFDYPALIIDKNIKL